MSITVTTDVFCDVCNDWVEGVSGRDFADKENARKHAKQHGWIMMYWDGKLIDLCPECQKENKRPPLFR